MQEEIRIRPKWLTLGGPLVDGSSRTCLRDNIRYSMLLRARRSGGLSRGPSTDIVLQATSDSSSPGVDFVSLEKLSNRYYQHIRFSSHFSISFRVLASKPMKIITIGPVIVSALLHRKLRRTSTVSVAATSIRRYFRLTLIKGRVLLQLSVYREE